MEKKLLSTIIFVFLILIFFSCRTKDPTNPLVDDSSFTDYVPWWETDDVNFLIVTNEIDSLEGEEYEHFK